jgi:cell division protein FtsA
MKSGYVAAIDIGTTKIVAIVGYRNENGRLEIAAMGRADSTGVTRGEVINIDKTVQSIREAMLVSAKHLPAYAFDSVVVGIAGKHIRCSQNRGYITRDEHYEEISEADVKKLIQDQYNVLIQPGEEIIHVLPQNFLVDKEYDVANPVGMYGKRLEANFHMVIGKVDSINYIKKSITKSGLAVSAIVLEPLASAEAVLSDDEKEVGVALVDIGGGTTDVAIFYEGIIKHTAVIPFGGDVITRDIKEMCGILDRQAEQVKTRFGEALYDYAPDAKVVSVPGVRGREPKEISFKTLAGIIQARMEEIIDAVSFELEASGVGDRLGAGLVVTGGGSLLKNLPQLVAFKTGMDARIGYPTEHVVSDKIEDLNHPMFATAVGLVMKGLETAPPEKLAPLENLAQAVPDAAPEPEIACDDNFEHEAERELSAVSPKKRRGFIENVKDKLSGFLDVEDTKF